MQYMKLLLSFLILLTLSCSESNDTTSSAILNAKYVCSDACVNSERDGIGACVVCSKNLVKKIKIEEIENSIQKALLKPELLIREIEKFAKFSQDFDDGKSSERVIDATISFLHKDKSYLKRKPLNLIRKYKMRKRLNYFTFKSYNKPFTIKLDN